jgi:hypothetical protein
MEDTPPSTIGTTTGRKRKGNMTSPYFDVVDRNENSVPTIENPAVPRNSEGRSAGRDRIILSKSKSTEKKKRVESSTMRRNIMLLKTFPT